MHLCSHCSLALWNVASESYRNWKSLATFSQGESYFLVFLSLKCSNLINRLHQIRKNWQKAHRYNLISYFICRTLCISSDANFPVHAVNEAWNIDTCLLALAHEWDEGSRERHISKWKRKSHTLGRLIDIIISQFISSNLMYKDDASVSPRGSI